MKKHLFLFTLLSVFVFTQVGWGQTTYTWIGGVSDWNTASNWNPARNTPANNDIIQFNTPGTFNPYSIPNQTIGQLIIPTNSIVTLSLGGNTLTIESSAIVNGTLDAQGGVISGTGSFTLGATGTLNIQNAAGIDGAIAVSGTRTFTDGASYVFRGTPTTTPFSSSVVSVVATNITTYHWVTLNKDVSVSGIVTIQSPLTLGTNNLTLQYGATIVGSGGSLGSNYKMIDVSGTGELRKEFTTTGSFTFPIGTAISNTYSPVTVNFTSGTFRADYVGVKFINSKHPNNTSATNFINRYWTITQSGISSFSCDVTATYVAGDVAGTEASIYCGAYNGSAWTQYSATNTGSHQLTATAVTSFPKDFTGGEPSALPVELTSFTAFSRDSKVELKWKTATELNNYGFEIERSVVSDQRSVISGQLSEWEKIGFVNGAGNSNSPKEYSFIDHSVLSGSYSYRLKQLDNNGIFKYSSDVEVTVGQFPNDYSLNQNYPNPFNPETKIRYSIPIVETHGGASVQNVLLKVYDMLGREVATLVNEVQEAGTYEVSFNGKSFTSGAYFYRFQSGDFVKINKMTLMK